MTGNLLDTSAALLLLTFPERLSRAARDAIELGPNRLSVVSYWEVTIKSMKGNLNVGDPRVWWMDALEQLAADILPLQPKHVAELLQLPPLHQDPFDRALIAQAAAEKLLLVTTDTAFRGYESDRVQILI